MHRRGLTLGEGIVLVFMVLVVAALFAVFLEGPFLGRARTIACANNLSQLWKMQCIYKHQHGGAWGIYVQDTGGAFWIRLSQGTKPLIDSSMVEIYACPVKRVPPRPGTTDYL